MIEIKNIDHVVLRTTKLGAMLAFYRDILGCEVERQLPDIGLLQLRAGSSLIDLVPVDSELGRQGGKPPQQDGRNLEHLCLLINAMEEAVLLEHLRDHGIATEELSERYGATGYGRSLYISDPEGNVVELKLDS